MRPVSQMTEIHPNIFKASEKCIYIRLPSGELKFCSIERFEKLMHRHNGNAAELVAKYRTRHVTVAVPETSEAKIKRLKDELEVLELAEMDRREKADAAHSEGEKNG